MLLLHTDATKHCQVSWSVKFANTTVVHPVYYYITLRKTLNAQKTHLS